MPGRLEHLNVTVSDPDATARLLCDLFDWKVRWSGASIHGGRSVHVGDEESYLALYTMGEPAEPAVASYGQKGGLNHLGVVVEDIDTTEARVRGAGFEPHSHADYEPGRRFYFDAHDGIEIEVVSYP